MVHKSRSTRADDKTSKCRQESKSTRINTAIRWLWLVFSLWKATPEEHLSTWCIPTMDQSRPGGPITTPARSPPCRRQQLQPSIKPSHHTKRTRDQTPTMASVADTQQVWADVWWRLPQSGSTQIWHQFKQRQKKHGSFQPTHPSNQRLQRQNDYVSIVCLNVFEQKWN